MEDKITYPTAWNVLPTASRSLTALTIPAATSETKTGCFTVFSPLCQSGTALIWCRQNFVYVLPTNNRFNQMTLEDDAENE
jgi:hypothetical protein